MIKRLSIILSLVVMMSSAKAQSGVYQSHVQEIYRNIGKYFSDTETGLYYETTDSAHNENPHSWLWPLCALIQAGNEMEVLEPGKDYMSPVVKAIDQYYNPKPPAPAYQDYVTRERQSSRFYDDNEWIAIAYLDAYNRTKEPRYLKLSKMIYRFLMTGRDTVAGGGLYWKEGDRTTKNTCSNGPAILVALQLYKITKKPDYLKTALAVYNWTNKHLQSPEGIYYDNIKIPSMRIAKVAYTYNTGTMLQANALLYTITRDKKYLLEAQRIAGAGKKHFYKNGQLPPNYWFNAVMMRGYAELYRIDGNKDWLQFFKDDADRIWKNERDENNLLGTEKYKKLIDQAGMLEIYARIAEYTDM